MNTFELEVRLLMLRMSFRKAYIILISFHFVWYSFFGGSFRQSPYNAATLHYEHIIFFERKLFVRSVSLYQFSLYIGVRCRAPPPHPPQVFRLVAVRMQHSTSSSLHTATIRPTLDTKLY